MKTSNYIIYPTEKGIIKRIAKSNDGVEKCDSQWVIEMATDMSRRIYRTITKLKSCEKLIITCNLITDETAEAEIVNR